MPDQIIISDLAQPELTQMQLGAIAAMPAMDITVEGVVQAAKAATGLSDFGADDFLQRLGIWVEAINADTPLNAFGRASLFGDCVRLCCNRLKLENKLKQHPEILETALPEPVIIAGLPRSGTTHLVNILASDSRFNSMPLWETMDPVADDGIAVGADDPRHQNCREMWGQFETLLPYMPAMHEMAPDHVHEDVELMGADFSGYVLEWVCRPHAWRDHYLKHDQTPHYAYAKKILQYLTWRRGPAKWVMKSPPHMENFNAVQTVYPDAKVIITHRDPVAVLQSAITMIGYGDRLRRDEIDLPALADYWIDRLETMLQRCVRDRENLPPDSSMDVLFHEYMADQNGTIERAYALAGLEITPEARRVIDSYLADNQRGKHGQVVYDLVGDFGVDIDAVRDRFAFYYDKFPVRKEPVKGETI
ncbi:MAG: sulfotransferase family protein [Parvibaculales bacterium]